MGREPLSGGAQQGGFFDGGGSSSVAVMLVSSPTKSCCALRTWMCGSPSRDTASMNRNHRLLWDWLHCQRGACKCQINCTGPYILPPILKVSVWMPSDITAGVHLFPAFAYSAK